MDTLTAISTLQAVFNGNISLLAGYVAQNDALKIAIDQLKGILDTPSADLAKTNDIITTLNTRVDTLNDQVAILNDQLIVITKARDDALAQPTM